ncbi:hypothetical protein PRIC1_007023 [Phytophthora ramorum]|uniref:RxLR effector protein n=1 Tax=Phytophthora ramorum TaxID=164328 RepID=H3H2K9_PHYRM|nr:Secreted RxLR effector protein [Phytophthora ramorum]
MRVHCIILATAVMLLAGCDSAFAATDAEHTRIVAMMTAETSVSTYGGQNDGADNRILRAEGTVDDTELSAEDEERESGDFVENVKFYYWLKMGNTPADIYQKFFKGVDRAIVLKNPNYEVWKRYKAYYEEDAKSA